MNSDAGKKNSVTKAKASEDKSSSKTDTSSSNRSSPENTKTNNKSTAQARPTSYFSSVSTDEYRSGWDTIFSGTKSGSNGPGKNTIKREASINFPLSITLSDDDLNEELADLLKAAVRKRAKKDKLLIGKHLNKLKLRWHLECEIGE